MTGCLCTQDGPEYYECRRCWRERLSAECARRADEAKAERLRRGEPDAVYVPPPLGDEDIIF